MVRIKTTSLVLLAAILLSACQLFEPLPTLPPVLTLEPLAPEATSSVSTAVLPGTVPETAATEAQQSPQATTTSTAQPAQVSASPVVTLPASATSLSPTQAASAVPSPTSKPTKQPATSAPPPAPTAASATAWREVPIMPGAIDGKEEEGSYSYSVNASLKDVQAYYKQTMPLSGWEPFATGEGEAGNLLLMYQKGNITATIGLIYQDQNTLVLIVAE
jgi:hypothetical protein